MNIPRAYYHIPLFCVQEHSLSTSAPHGWPAAHTALPLTSRGDNEAIRHTAPHHSPSLHPTSGLRSVTSGRLGGGGGGTTLCNSRPPASPGNPAGQAGGHWSDDLSLNRPGPHRGNEPARAPGSGNRGQ